MEARSPGSGQSSGPDATESGERLVYVMSRDDPTGRADNEIDLFKLWNTLWRSRWLIVATTAVFGLGAAIVASLLPPVYSANVVLAPVKGDDVLGGLAGSLGGLASLAGIRAGGSGNIEAVAVLRSRDFARAFIEDENLLPVLFPDNWDAAAGRWKQEPGPDYAQAARFFVGRVRRVDEDRSGLVTLSIDWRDPEQAAAWANLLAARLNDHMRKRALAEAEENVNYLRHEFESTSVVPLQQSIGGLLENEMQKLMLARGNAEFAFRIIDRAEVSRAKLKPRVTLIVVLAAFFGGVFSVFVVLVRDMIRNRPGVAPPTAGVTSARA
jgi:uncharacterized protein involved in exopolysaccharide biosynthesis